MSNMKKAVKFYYGLEVIMGNDDYAWAGRVADKIYEKMKMSVMRNRDKIPYLAADGIFDDWSDRISWWTNGFYGGQLWQLYHAYGDGIFPDRPAQSRYCH